MMYDDVHKLTKTNTSEASTVVTWQDKWKRILEKGWWTDDACKNYVGNYGDNDNGSDGNDMSTLNNNEDNIYTNETRWLPTWEHPGHLQCGQENKGGRKHFLSFS